MQRKLIAVLSLVFFVMFGIGAFSSSAQEFNVEVDDFGAGQVFSAFFQAQRVGDLVLFMNGSVASATLLNDEVSVESADGEILTVPREELTAIRFNEVDGDVGARLFSTTGDHADGRLLTELDIEYALFEQSEISANQLSAIVMKLEPVRVEETQVDEEGNESTVVTETVMLDFSEIFPIMTRMFASMSNFDTAILPDNRLASIALENRADLEITIDSVNFGLFTFPADEIAFIQFAQSNEDRDILVLEDGDRVSGQIVVEGSLTGTLGIGAGSFSFDESSLRAQFKQIVFELPTNLFGGGGGGHGSVITSEDE